MKYYKDILEIRLGDRVVASVSLTHTWPAILEITEAHITRTHWFFNRRKARDIFTWVSAGLESKYNAERQSSDV